MRVTHFFETPPWHRNPRSPPGRFAILTEASMRILFAISVVAFVALLWAFFSTAQHIRRARRRRKLAASARLAAETRTSTDAAVPLSPPPQERPATAAPDETLAGRYPLSSHRNIRFIESSTAQPVAPPPPPRPDPLKPSGMGLSRPATSPLTGDRQDWAYFNKDMGDLSDPRPSRHYKDRSRSR